MKVEPEIELPAREPMRPRKVRISEKLRRRAQSELSRLRRASTRRRNLLDD
jgi:hypothetical protein